MLSFAHKYRDTLLQATYAALRLLGVPRVFLNKICPMTYRNSISVDQPNTLNSN